MRRHPRKSKRLKGIIKMILEVVVLILMVAVVVLALLLRVSAAAATEPRPLHGGSGFLRQRIIGGNVVQRADTFPFVAGFFFLSKRFLLRRLSLVSQKPTLRGFNFLRRCLQALLFCRGVDA